MATTKSLTSLEKSKEAVLEIREKLLPVLQQLTNDKFGAATGRAQASVALSIGMMRYMGARLRGLDQGRKPDDPLRKDLNNIKRVLAKTKKAEAVATGKANSETKTPTKPRDPPTTNSSNSEKNKSDDTKEKETEHKAQNETREPRYREGKSNEKKRKTIQSESASKKSRKK